MKLHKFTTRYCQYQDRLCIDGQAASGDILSLWLTHRLMRNLLPELIKLITPVTEGASHSDTLAQWELAHAQANQKVDTPVEVPSHTETESPSTNSLISSVNMSSTAQQVLMTFSTTQSQVATIEFSPDHIRQWVSILYRTWRSTGWTTEVFPTWMQETESPALSANIVMH